MNLQIFLHILSNKILHNSSMRRSRWEKLRLPETTKLKMPSWSQVTGLARKEASIWPVFLLPNHVTVQSHRSHHGVNQIHDFAHCDSFASSCGRPMVSQAPLQGYQNVREKSPENEIQALKGLMSWWGWSCLVPGSCQTINLSAKDKASPPLEMILKMRGWRGCWWET